MRKIIQASVLVLTLAIPVFAGEIPYGVTSPPPAPASITGGGEIPNGATATGYIPNGVTGDIPNNVTGEIPFGATFLGTLLSLFSLI
jgi:hypothetical protein